MGPLLAIALMVVWSRSRLRMESNQAVTAPSLRIGRFGATLETMELKRLVGTMLAAALVVTLTAQPLLPQPSKPRACCGKSCPPPPQSAPATCCRVAPMPPATAAIAQFTPPLLAWAIVVVLAQPISQTTSQVVPFAQDPSPPQADRLVVSGLAPPSLA